MRRAIITAAVTGAIHTPSMSPHLPISADEIANAAIEAAQAGAAIVHLHARDPENGRPSQDPELFKEFVPKIEAACDVIINITTGGSPIMPLDERLAPAAKIHPEIASLNMGSMNFGFFEAADRFEEFKHDWERPYLENSYDLVFKNTFSDIETILTRCAETGTRFEVECYDTNHLYTAAYFRDKGLLPEPLLIQTVFGVRGGIGSHYEDVMMMKRTADRLFGADYIWSVLGIGRHQFPIAAISAALGGNIRVGLEDSLWLAPGQLAQTSAEQVSRAKTILQALSIEAATADEAREILKLKGRGSNGDLH